MFKAFLLAATVAATAAPASASIVFQQSGLLGEYGFDVPTVDLKPGTYSLRATFSRPRNADFWNIGHYQSYAVWCEADQVFCGGNDNFIPAQFTKVSSQEYIATLTLNPGARDRSPGRDFFYADRYRGGPVNTYVIDEDYDTPTNYTFTITVLEYAAVPEPATWALMIGGFGMVGGSLRRRARVRVAFG